MYEHYKEAGLPDTYRSQALECITSTLAMQRSLRLAGLSGMGKSNLLRFLVSHPHILENDPGFPADSVCFLHIDCNKLNPVNALTFYRECNFLLASPPGGVPETADAYLLYKQFERALRQVDRSRLVILVIDRIESLYRAANRAFFGQLRNLRDEARSGQMLFVFGGRRPVEDLYELEKLFSHTCWVGPLSAADWTEFLARHQSRLNLTIPEAWRKLLWHLTGGHPGLLKNSLEWLKWREADDAAADEAAVMSGLLGYKPIQRYCHSLWENLTQEEKEVLMALSETSDRPAVRQRLQESGLLTGQAQEWSLFSPLWAAYLGRHVWPDEAVAPLQIELDPVARRAVLRWRGRTTETVIRRNLVFELLRALAAAPGEIVSKDKLIKAIYEGEKASEVFDDALFQLVTALRQTLDPVVKQLSPAMTRSCVQNVRGVGYRLLIDLSTEIGD